jgi:hypothetical protein
MLIFALRWVLPSPPVWTKLASLHTCWPSAVQLLQEIICLFEPHYSHWRNVKHEHKTGMERHSKGCVTQHVLVRTNCASDQVSPGFWWSSQRPLIFALQFRAIQLHRSRFCMHSIAHIPQASPTWSAATKMTVFSPASAARRTDVAVRIEDRLVPVAAERSWTPAAFHTHQFCDFDLFPKMKRNFLNKMVPTERKYVGSSRAFCCGQVPGDGDCLMWVWGHVERMRTGFKAGIAVFRGCGWNYSCSS